MITLLIDVIGIGLIVPVLPLLVGEFTSGRDTQAYWYGAVAVTYGATQFMCAPLLGALSDRFGRRPLLLLGIAGLGATFLLTAVARSLWLIVGFSYVCVLAASALVPFRLNWKRDLAPLPKLHRQMYWTYGGYVVLGIVALGVHDHEAGRVPDLVCKISITGDALRR